MNPDYSTCADGCEVNEGLSEALGDDFIVLFENYDAQGFGHHSANAVFQTDDGRFIHADCGGCSCQGYGTWEECSREEAFNRVPEQERK